MLTDDWNKEDIHKISDFFHPIRLGVRSCLCLPPWTPFRFGRWLEIELDWFWLVLGF